MHFNIAHKTTKTEAKQRVKDGLEQARPHLKDQAEILKEEWEGDILAFEVLVQGKKISGTLAVTDTEFVIDAKLPLMWRLFEGTIEREIAKQVQALR